MKYCPLCAAEYRQESEICSTCRARLVASLNSEEVRANPPRLLWIGRDAVEFDLVAGALHDAYVPELVEEGPTGLLQMFLKSESQICVLQNDFDRAVQIASQTIGARSDLRGASQKCHHCGSACSASLTACPSCQATLIVERKMERKNFAPAGTAIQYESKYCPLCDAEYPASFESCTVCGVELVPEGMRGQPLTEQDKKDRLVIVWRGGDPVAVSRVVSLLRDAGIRHHVESTHDYFVFELAMPRPRYTVRVLEADAQQAGEVLAGVTDSPFFGAAISPDFPADENASELQVSSNWNLAAATVEVWAGEDAALARVLEDCLRENRVGFRREERESRGIQLFVMAADETAARAIIREILEATPPV